jgi:hypothetical protein
MKLKFIKANIHCTEQTQTPRPTCCLIVCVTMRHSPRLALVYIDATKNFRLIYVCSSGDDDLKFYFIILPDRVTDSHKTNLCCSINNKYFIICWVADRQVISS